MQHWQYRKHRHRQTTHRLALGGTAMDQAASCLAGVVINTSAAHDDGYARRSLLTQHAGPAWPTRNRACRTARLGQARSPPHVGGGQGGTPAWLPRNRYFRNARFGVARLAPLSFARGRGGGTPAWPTWNQVFSANGSRRGLNLG